MMKITLILLLQISAVINISAQGIDYNKIVMPANAEGITLAERLVQIAWNNHPLNEIQRRSISVAEMQMKQSRWSWLDNIGLVGNLNEFNIDPSRDINNRSQFFPRYNVSARVSLGMFVSIPLQTQIGKERVIIEESNLKSRMIELRAEVLKRYNAYLTAEEAFTIHSEMLEDAQNNFSFYEDKFTKGEIEYERYAEQKDNLNRTRIVLINSEANLESRRIELEEILGVSLQDVF